MKSRFLLSLLMMAFPAIIFGETMEAKIPLKQRLGGNTSFDVAGGKKLALDQAGDSTTVKLNGESILTLEAPQFVEAVIQSPNRAYALILVGKDRSIGYDYHSIIRFEFSKDGGLTDTKILLAKTSPFMSEMYRWVRTLDSVLNDGRTARVNFGEQIDKADPHMKIRYSWQIRDLETGQLYRDDPEPKK